MVIFYSVQPSFSDFWSGFLCLCWAILSWNKDKQITKQMACGKALSFCSCRISHLCYPLESSPYLPPAQGPLLSLLSCWHTHLAVCGHAFLHILHYPTLSSCCLGKILPVSPSPFIWSISYPNQVCLCSSLLPKWFSNPPSSNPGFKIFYSHKEQRGSGYCAIIPDRWE